MNENTRARLLLFFIGIPLFFSVLCCFPFAHFAILVVFLLTVQYLSSLELRSMLSRGGLHDPGLGVTIAGLVQSAAVYVACVLSVSPSEVGLILFFASLMCLTIELVPLGAKKKALFPGLLKEAGSIVLVHFYTALLPSLLVLIVSGFPDARNATTTFVLLTIGNDSLAWLFGKYIGKKRNVVDVSPNKSIAGFIGGTIGSIAGAFLGLGPLAGSWRPLEWNYIILSLTLGMGMAFFVIAGDLFESALKRSAGAKDSGDIVPGRGGVLDSFDSLYFSAPFFVAFSFLFHLFGL
ncbi:putative Phosphatidate cytidylyltransferase [uncultured spirochete]|uniref:Phosphatidate cytidylyltransferase n=1 Tax=uncultured spirochete TaxID=156406 RepID=A0A3P3XTU5_9SPIR|nr:putative Phosphatidate cytidylyltransferase [uncultured spirochete]